MTIQAFRPTPRTGVIYVMTEAARAGFTPGDKQWANLGQGAPETGLLPESPDRMSSIPVGEVEYSPVDGLPELKRAVADLYNARYRVGKKSQYTEENVSICAGGRLALTRIVSTLGRVNVGHFLPDYTAYEELLDAFGTFVPIPILLNPANGYHLPAASLKEEILGRGLAAIVLSNPSNPTGRLLEGDNLREWVSVCRETGCSMIADEFYSHYVYGNQLCVSAAEYVEDVNTDPVIVLDGLTKNWRYPGLRVAWTLGPKHVIESIASAGSFLDGGCSRPIQSAATQLLSRETADNEARAIQKQFQQKRRLMRDGLASLGIMVEPEPQATFYCWGDLSKLPAPLNNGMEFFKAALEHKTIVVPGQFFDINPGSRRLRNQSRFASYARFSFGPSIDEIECGLRNLGSFLRGH